MKFSKPLLALAVAGLSLLVANTQAYAEDAPTCNCVTGFSSTPYQIGSVLRVEGNVLVSKPTGLLPAGSGDVLAANSRLLVGPGASANITVGLNCRMKIRENSAVSMPLNGELVCVRVREVAARPAKSPINNSASGQPRDLITGSIDQPAGPPQSQAAGTPAVPAEPNVCNYDDECFLLPVGLAAAGGVIGIIVGLSNDNNRSVSP